MILHEIEVSNDTFDVDKQRRNRAPIYSIGLQFYSKFETVCLVKNRASMEPNRATIWQTLQLGYEFNEAIVLRFTASEYDFSVSENFPIRGKLFSEVRVKILEKETDCWSWRSGEKVGDHQNSYLVTNFM